MSSLNDVVGEMVVCSCMTMNPSYSIAHTSIQAVSAPYGKDVCVSLTFVEVHICMWWAHIHQMNHVCAHGDTYVGGGFS